MRSRWRPRAGPCQAVAVLWAVCLFAAAGPVHADNLALTTPGLFRSGTQGFSSSLLAQDDAAPPHSGHSTDDTGDLTELSLEELLDLNVTTINVLGSHTHLKGQTMVGYRFMSMTMDGYLNGTDEISNSEVLRHFPTIHTRMEMSEHMLELMHAFTDDFTVMAMVPYKHGVMHHVKADGTRFTVRSSGLGDVNLMGMYNVLGDPRGHGQRLIVNAGVTFPTGSTSVRDATPTDPHAKLEYPMQLGSGTFDLLPGLTYLGESGNWSWGAQALGVLRLGRNDEGYRFGHQGHFSAWTARKITDWFAPSVRADARVWGNVVGRDPELDPTVNPESDPGLQGGRRVDLLLGLNFYAPRGGLKGQRLSLEGGLPVYQSLNGPQLSTDWQVNVAWSVTF